MRMPAAALLPWVLAALTAAGGTVWGAIASGLIAAKRAQLTTLQNRLNAASALFGQGLAGAGVYVLHVTGAMGNAGLKEELLAATGGAGPELSFCAGVGGSGWQPGRAGRGAGDVSHETAKPADESHEDPGGLAHLNHGGGGKS